MTTFIQWLQANQWIIYTFVSATAVSLVLGHQTVLNALLAKYPRIAALVQLSQSMGFDPWQALRALQTLLFGRLPAGYLAALQALLKLLGASVLLLCLGARALSQ